MRKDVNRFVRIALMAALLCLICPISLPLGGLPISLATFAVCLCGGLLGPLQGAAAVCIYLALGALGLPVFAGFQGGIQRIFDLTGGYLVGYLPCAFIAGLSLRNIRHKRPTRILGVFLGELICLLAGFLWYSVSTQASALAAFLITVPPYLIPEFLKAIAAEFCTSSLKKKLDLY